MSTHPKFALFQGVLEENFGQKFFSDNLPEENQTKLDDGRVAYKILGYAETVEEAQTKLYGRVCRIPSKRNKPTTEPEGGNDGQT